MTVGHNSSSLYILPNKLKIVAFQIKQTTIISGSISKDSWQSWLYTLPSSSGIQMYICPIDFSSSPWFRLCFFLLVSSSTLLSQESSPRRYHVFNTSANSRPNPPRVSSKSRPLALLISLQLRSKLRALYSALSIQIKIKHTTEKANSGNVL